MSVCSTPADKYCFKSYRAPGVYVRKRKQLAGTGRLLPDVFVFVYIGVLLFILCCTERRIKHLYVPYNILSLWFCMIA